MDLEQEILKEIEKKPKIKTIDIHTINKKDPTRNELYIKHFIDNYRGFAHKNERIKFNEKRKDHFISSLSPEVLQFKCERDLRYILFSLIKNMKGKRMPQTENLYRKLRKLSKIELLVEISKYMKQHMSKRLTRWQGIIDEFQIDDPN